MAERHQTTIVGVFALSAMTLLFVLTLMFGGGRSLFEETYDFSIRFREAVDGISVGQPVTLNGKRVGETKKIEFWDADDLTQGLRIVVAVQEKYKVPANSTVEVSPGLIQFGRPPIRIVLGKGPLGDLLPLDGTGTIRGRVVSMPEQVLPPRMQHQVQRVMDEIADLAAAMRPVAGNLETLLEARSTTSVDTSTMPANLATAIQRFDDTLRNIDSIIADEQNLKNIRQTLENARLMSASGVAAMADLREFSATSKIIIADAGEVLRTLAETADRLSSVLIRIDSTLASLNNPKGTIGSLLNDNRLYEELLLSARRLTNAIDDMREVLDIAKKGQLRIKAF